MFCALRLLTPVFCFLPLLSCFRKPRRVPLRGSTVTNCGGGSSPAGILPHKDCLFCFTWTIFVCLSLFLSSFIFFLCFNDSLFHLVFLFVCLFVIISFYSFCLIFSFFAFFFSAFLSFLPFSLPPILIRWVGGGFYYYFVFSSANGLVTSIIKRAC